jgi:hypothetical protein
MAEPIGINTECIVKFDDGPDLSRVVHQFKWRTFVNNGYVIFARIVDPNLGIFQELTSEKYLKDARKRPFKISFQFKHLTGGDNEKQETVKRIAYVTNLEAGIPDGSQSAGFFEFVAIDPPTWYLNRGDASGTVFKGKVSDVIKRVINLYAPSIEQDITETDDNATNKWYMMRQDPKTFISTLLDWSPSVTKRKRIIISVWVIL